MDTNLPLQSTGTIHLNSARGSYLYSSNEKIYIDFESGFWFVNLGYCDDRISQAIIEHTGYIVHHGARFRNKYSKHLAKKLLDLTGFPNGTTVFLNSGSGAVNLSVSLAQQLTGRKRVIQVIDTCIGVFGFGSHPMSHKHLYSIDIDQPEPLKHINLKECCALVLETGCASPEETKFLKHGKVERIAHIVKEAGCLLLANEVTTGLGRTGKWWGFQHYKILPDIIIADKAIGNGFPISAVIVSAVFADKLATFPSQYLQSHQNDPFGCRVGLEVVKALKEDDI